MAFFVKYVLCMVSTGCTSTDFTVCVDDFALMKTLKDGPPCMFPNMANGKIWSKIIYQKMWFLVKCGGTWSTACKHDGFPYVLKTFQSEKSQGWTPSRKHTYPDQDQKSKKIKSKHLIYPGTKKKILVQSLLNVHEKPGSARWLEFQRCI